MKIVDAIGIWMISYIITRYMYIYMQINFLKRKIFNRQKINRLHGYV